MRRIALALWLLSAVAVADEPTKDGKRTVVNFDGDTIDGDLLRPEGDLMAVRPGLELPSLVRAPRDFDRAAQRTLEAAADAAGRVP